MTQPVAVTAIVAWIWAGMFAQLLQDGGFVGGLVWLADSAGVGAALFPAITFVLAAVFTTGIGTGYGATVAFVGLFFPAGVLLGANPVLLFGAILSGAIFGDNLAPVSDTTIVSAVTQDADIGASSPRDSSTSSSPRPSPSSATSSLAERWTAAISAPKRRRSSSREAKRSA